MAYLIGIIKKINKNTLIIENNNIGYKIYTYKTAKFKINQKILIYIYEILLNNGNVLVGIQNKEEYSFFKSILKLRGIGYKTAIRFLDSIDYNHLISILKSNNINKLDDFININRNIKNQLKEWKK